jgi:hypothetical protein
MAVDYKLYQPHQDLPPNTVWILEQIPGYVEQADVTSFVNENGYWASYNV